MTQTHSDEQLKYIKDPIIDCDTKLLAIAGSGKTRCVIARIDHMIKCMNVPAESIVSVTFSKNSQQDFLSKVRKSKNCQILKDNICTIDSLAWKSLSPDIRQRTDVSILSYSFMMFLQTHTKEQIQQPTDSNRIMSNIRHIFVDEAQDLNQTQYDILVSLKKKLGVFIHMIGDPSQSIFQFRKSSAEFMMGFPAQSFQLSTNFRSCPKIVNFSSYLRAHTVSTNISSAKPASKSVIKLVSVRDAEDFETTIISLIDTYRRLHIPFEKCAILAPTRGKIRDMKGLPSYIGLCYVANLLHQHGVPFNQFYGELVTTTAKVMYKPVVGLINLLTYHGSKGLEWNNVIVIDANAYLISKYGYNVSHFAAEQYLLYVACSRACNNMVIVTKVGMASPWFKNIPADLYASVGLTLKIFDRNQLDFEETKNKSAELCFLRNVISSFEEKVLYEFSECLSSVACDVTMMETRSTWGTAEISDESKRMLLSNVLQNYFLLCASDMKCEDYTLFNDLKKILIESNETNVVLCKIPSVYRWYSENKTLMCWALYDKLNDDSRIDRNVRNFVMEKFDRNWPFAKHSLVDKFHYNYITKNIDEIKRKCKKHLENSLDFESFCCLSTMNYAIETNNFFLLDKIEVISKKICTNQILEVAASIQRLCLNNSIHTKWNCNKIKVVVCSTENDKKLGTQGVVDYVDENDVSVTIKCVSNISLSNVLEALICDIMRKKQPTYISKFSIINVFDGKKHTYNATLDENIVRRLWGLINGNFPEKN